MENVETKIYDFPLVTGGKIPCFDLGFDITSVTLGDDASNAGITLAWNVYVLDMFCNCTFTVELLTL